MSEGLSLLHLPQAQESVLETPNSMKWPNASICQVPFKIMDGIDDSNVLPFLMELMGELDKTQ